MCISYCQRTVNNFCLLYMITEMILNNGGLGASTDRAG